MIVVTILFTLLFTLIVYVKSRHLYWQQKKIPTLPPVFFFGNLWDVFTAKKQQFESIIDAYKAFPEYKYVGYYKSLKPTLIIRDPELLNKILFSDFPHFENNDVDIDKDIDFIASKSVFFMNGDEWRTVKALLSPMFTSGKLKSIFPLLENVAEKLTRHINKLIDTQGGKEIDGLDLIRRCNVENIASCTFGLEANAFEEGSEFVDAVEKTLSPSYWNGLKFMIVFLMPFFSKILHLKLFPDEVADYLMTVVKESIKYRKDNNIVRNDFLDMITQLKENSKNYKFTDQDIVAQAAGFFADGIGTTSVVMCSALAEMSLNKEVQEKLRREINNVKEKHTKITYEALQELTYLDNILSETMRKHPPALSLFKVCTKEYELPPAKEGLSTLKLYPGDSILIPVGGLQRDPEYFPRPQKFDPDRFNDENKYSIIKNTYLPYGVGPRICLGIRFAILLAKFHIVEIISKFNVKANERMQDLDVINTKSFLTMPASGYWFDFEKI